MEKIKQYYDNNTGKFLLKKGIYAMHRAVWAPGIGDTVEALRYNDSRILEHLSGIPEGAVIDLGCGVGGTMLYLASVLKNDFFGITLSSVQQAKGAVLIRNAEQEDRIRIIQGDFSEPSTYSEVPLCSAAYAVESLIHCRDKRKILDSLKPVLVKDGLLLVIDDFLKKPGVDKSSSSLLKRFINNWHAYGLQTVEEFSKTVEDTGFRVEAVEELTAWTLKDSVSKRGARIAAAVLRRFPLMGDYARNIVGGAALQELTRRGDMGYFFLILRYRSE